MIKDLNEYLKDIYKDQELVQKTENEMIEDSSKKSIVAKNFTNWLSKNKYNEDFKLKDFKEMINKFSSFNRGEKTSLINSCKIIIENRKFW